MNLSVYLRGDIRLCMLIFIKMSFSTWTHRDANSSLAYPHPHAQASVWLHETSLILCWAVSSKVQHLHTHQRNHVTAKLIMSRVQCCALRTRPRRGTNCPFAKRIQGTNVELEGLCPLGVLWHQPCIVRLA